LKTSGNRRYYFAVPRDLEDPSKPLDIIRLIREFGETIPVKKRRKAGKSKYSHGKQVMSVGKEDTGEFLKLFKSHIEKCYFVLHRIIEVGYKQNDTSDDFVRLQKKLLHKIVTKPTLEQVLSVLKTLGIIEINESYFFNFGNPLNTDDNFCKSYKLTSTYTSQATIFVPTTKKVTKKISECLSDKTGDLLESTHHPEYAWQRNMFLKEGIYSVEDKEVFSSLLQSFLDKGESLDEVHPEDKLFNQAKMNVYQLHLNKLDNGIPDFSMFERCNRVGTSLAFATHYVRPFLRDRNGECLLQIDFTSSHALHLIKVITDSIKGYPYIINIGGEEEGRRYPYIATPKLKSLNTNNLISEIEGLKDKILHYTPDIYKYFADKYEERHGTRISPNPVIERTRMKDLWNASFLCGYYANTRKDPIWIRSLYPEISKYIELTGYKKFACMLLNSEAKLMNNIIIREVMKVKRDCLLFGLFDAVIVESAVFDEVKSIMYEKAEEYFGFPVKLKPHDYTLDLERYMEYLYSSNTGCNELVPMLSFAS
jgi:hypothetical protein